MRILLFTFVFLSIFMENAYSVELKHLKTIGTKGEGKGQFNLPYNIAIDSFGLIYVTDTDNNRVQVLSKDGIYITNFAEGYLHKPTCIAITKNNDIIICNYERNEVLIFASNGRLVKKIKSTKKHSINGPSSIALDDVGNLYLTDSYNHNVKIYNENFNFLFSFGEKTSIEIQEKKESKSPLPFKLPIPPILTDKPQKKEDKKFTPADNSTFLFPSGISVKENKIYVSDSLNNRVQVFDKKGSFLKILSSGRGFFKAVKYPSGLEIYNEKVFVADTGNNRIVIFDKDLSLTKTFGRKGIGANEFFRPMDIKINKKRAYIADSGNNQIKIYKIID